jgi:hypothetical protein
MHNHILPADGLSTIPEAVLFEWAQADCQPCLNHLVVHHKRLVVFVVRRQSLGKLPFEEALPSAVRPGLCRPDGLAFGKPFSATTRREGMPSLPMRTQPSLARFGGQSSKPNARFPESPQRLRQWSWIRPTQSTSWKSDWFRLHSLNW